MTTREKEGHMNTKKVFWFCALFAIVLMPHIAGAGDLWMVNGDHISGKVIRMEGENLRFETTYAGEITVSWKDVKALRTEIPVSIVLQDGSIGKGMVTGGENGRAEMKSESMETPVSFLLSEVKEINPAPPGPPIKLKGRVNVGVTVTRGNTETETSYGEGELIARSAKNRFTVGARFAKEADGGEETVNRQSGYMKYDHFLTKKLYFQANAAATKDPFKDLNLRSSFGLGAGYQLLETERTNLAFEAGVNQVNEDFIVAEDKSFVAGRWAWNFDHFLYKRDLQFFHGLEGLISLKDTEDLTIQSQTGLRFFLFKHFNATAQFNYDLDKSPSPGLEKADKAFLFTLGYQF